eukprot:6590159-Prymnesium_polylepis.1
MKVWCYGGRGLQSCGDVDFVSLVARTPTQELDLLMWDCEALRFSHIERRVRCDIELLPRCCGRGASCPHLQWLRPQESHWSR